RLGTDYIDLYQMHAPDPSTPIDETLGALSDLVHAGKVRYIGHSNFSGWQIADAHWRAKSDGHVPFITAQNHYSLLERDVRHEVLPACEHFSVGMLPYFPLASGMLTGKYLAGQAAPEGTRLALVARLAERAMTDKNFATIDRLSGFAAEHGRDLLSLAFCWLLSQPMIASVIAGATTAEQVRANVEAAEGWRLNTAEMAEVAQLLKVDKS
ncbi:MAG: aldo/keto reductase, partial [Pseudomonadales bacterium]